MADEVPKVDSRGVISSLEFKALLVGFTRRLEEAEEELSDLVEEGQMGGELLEVARKLVRDYQAIFERSDLDELKRGQVKDRLGDRMDEMSSLIEQGTQL